MIHLEKITPENWRSDLAVSEEQRRFVSDPAGILARAYAYGDSRSRAFLICADKTPVGMALYYDCEEFRAFDFSQLLIDRRYQGKGHGFEAVKLILEQMRRDGKYQKVVLCYIDGNHAAKCLYEKAGFKLTGDRDGNEIIMEKSLR